MPWDIVRGLHIPQWCHGMQWQSRCTSYCNDSTKQAVADALYSPLLDAKQESQFEQPGTTQGGLLNQVPRCISMVTYVFFLHYVSSTVCTCFVMTSFWLFSFRFFFFSLFFSCLACFVVISYPIQWGAIYRAV